MVYDLRRRRRYALANGGDGLATQRDVAIAQNGVAGNDGSSQDAIEWFWHGADDTTVPDPGARARDLFRGRPGSRHAPGMKPDSNVPVRPRWTRDKYLFWSDIINQMSTAAGP